MKNSRKKHLVKKPAHSAFEDQMLIIASSFLGLTYDALLTARALKIARKDKTLCTVKKPNLLTLIYKGFEYNLGQNELENFVDNMTRDENLAMKYLVLFYSTAENLLREINPKKDVWGFDCEFDSPRYWFENLNFEDFVNFNTACLSELMKTRNDVIHNHGRISKTHEKAREKYEKNILDSLKRKPYSAIFFKDQLRKHLRRQKGKKIPVDFNFLGFAQMTLIERIFLKSGLYHHFFTEMGGDQKFQGPSFELGQFGGFMQQ